MFYELLHIVFWPLFRVLFSFRSRGEENIPRTGGVIIAANHASYLDPVVLPCAITLRSVYTMAKEELFRVRLFAAVIRAAHALPMKRGSVRPRALAAFASLARDTGWGLLVFPEGTRTNDGRLGEPRRGMGALCRASGVPVIPALIKGTYDIWPRHRLLPRPVGTIEVIFGPPVEWSDDEINASGDPSGALAAHIMKSISNLENEFDATPTGFWQGYRNVLKKALASLRLPRAPGHGSSSEGGSGDVQRD